MRSSFNRGIDGIILILGLVAILIIIAVVLWLFFGGGMQQMTGTIFPTNP
jgi:ABC-type transporter Mla subunit MlaD